MVKIYFKKINIFKDVLRHTKLNTKHYKTNISSIIIPLFLWKTIELYNGKKYIPININKKKIGYYLNNFIFQDKNNSRNKEFNIKIAI